jgi:DNA processing protein
VYGKACAIKFAEAFARAGVTVVSGGAVGIDAAAHEGALQAGGATAAVLATDVVTQYPAANAGLFLRIRQSGTLVSQFAIGSSAADHKFIIRNGLLATLSDALVVIECPPKSGSLHTAGFAADFGKQVFVVPGRIDQTNFFGGFDLVRDGATLAYNPDQVLEALQIESRGPASVAAVAQGTAGRILDCLGVDPISPERLGELTGLPPAELATELTMLELEGAVRKEAGGYVKPL